MRSVRLATAGTALLVIFAPSSASAAPGPEVGGYVFGGGGDSVDATFTVPRLRCGPDDAGVTSLATATGRRAEFGGAGVEASCVDGSKNYRAAFMTRASGIFPIDEVVRAGDVIHVSILIQGEDLIITVQNETRLWGVGTSEQDTGGDIRSAVIGDARLSVEGQVLPIPAFGRHTFSAIALDGSPPDPSRATRKLLRDDGTVLVRPSRLRDGATAFTARSTV